MRLNIKYRNKSVKNTKKWKLNNALLNNQEITEEIKEEIKKNLDTNDNENIVNDPKPMGCSQSSTKREVYHNTILPQETRNISNKQLNHTPKANRERRTKTPKFSRRKEIINIRAEINEKEIKKTIAKINKSKSWFFEDKQN